MQFILLIHTDQERWNALTPEQQAEHTEHHRELARELIEQKKWVDGARLHDPSTAANITWRDDQMIRSNGPYAETREMIGGYYVIECADMDEACAVAARVPTASYGTIEVRGLM